MGSYSDESYVPRTRSSGSGGSIFKPKPAPSSTTPPTTSKPPATGRAARVRPPVTTKVDKPTGKINLVLALDTTDSMGDARENMRDKSQYLYEDITQLLPELVGDMQIAFVGIGDHGDSPLMQPTAFSDNVQVLKSHLESIINTSGGDIAEAFECLFQEMNRWDLNDTNTVVMLVTDSVPHGMMSRGDDRGCPFNVNWETELASLKKKIRGFYLVSCSTTAVMQRLQKRLVDDENHFIDLGGNITRLTNVVHGIIAMEVGEINKYLSHLTQTRGAARADEVRTLLKTQN